RQHAVSVRERHQGLEAGHPHWNLCPVAVPHRFLLAIERAGVGRDDRDFATAKSLPQTLDVLGLLELRTAGIEVPVLAVENRVVENEVLHARLSEYRDTARLRCPYDIGAF